MALIVWSDKYGVNIKKINEQHKKLVNMNELHDVMKAGKGNDVLGKILSGLIQHVETHLAKEIHMF